MPNEFDVHRALRAKYPSDMEFAPFSNKFVENDPLKAPWLEAYFSGRSSLEFQGRSTRSEVRALLDSLGADSSDAIDRYRGAMLGVAIGDALGMPLEGRVRDTHTVADYEAGGPFQLERGRWTDETSMTCCVAYSLLKSDGFDPSHQLLCLSYWYRYAAYSSVMNRVVDIGQSVKVALDAFLANSKPQAQTVDRPSAGNASLTRLLPIVLFYHDDFEQCLHYAEQSSRLTHTSLEAVDACRYFAGAHFGEMTIPYQWVRWLTAAHGFYHFAQDLRAASTCARRTTRKAEG